MLRRLLLPAAVRRMAAAFELPAAAAAAAPSLPVKPTPSASPPAGASSSSTIDKSLFDKKLSVVALRVPAPLCASVIAQLRNASLLFSHPKLSAVVDEPQPAPSTPALAAPDALPNGAKGQKTKLVLLSPSAVPPAEQSSSPPSSASASSPAASLHPTLSSLIAAHGLTTVPHTVQLSFASHTLEQVLSVLLPSSVPPPSSFTTVGHIAHVNLLPCHLPYRHLIGAAIISCCSPVLRSVVNKTSSISDEYRVSPLELIAGDADLNAEVRESGCIFRFDYSRVYWNSRLSTEHQRIAGLVRDDETVVDMFAGCGPFVIPIARRRSAASASPAAIFANDKNSGSYASLVSNVALNHIAASLVHSHCLDAREFISAVVRPALLSGRLQQADHIIMNLPAQALDFIDCLHGLYESLGRQQPEEGRLQERQQPRLPVVHVYCFSKEEGEAGKVRDVMQRAEARLGVGLGTPVLSGEKREGQKSGGRERKRKREEERMARAAEEAKGAVIDTASAVPDAADRWSRPLLHFVRNVAPNKDMLCLSFRLPADVAFGTQRSQDSNGTERAAGQTPRHTPS